MRVGGVVVVIVSVEGVFIVVVSCSLELSATHLADDTGAELMSR
jgi:hypothetical protein